MDASSKISGEYLSSPITKRPLGFTFAVLAGR